MKRQRRGRKPLRDQLVERIILLGGTVDLGSPEGRIGFSEIWAGLAVPRIELHPVDGESHASLEDGGTVVVKALIYFEGEPIGLIQRRLSFGRKIAFHQFLFLGPSVRGKGLSVALLHASFALYDKLGLREVQLEAAMETGRWYWARVGFEFIRDEDARVVREWAVKVIEATRVKGLRVDRYTAAGQFARMGGRRTMSLRTIADAIPTRAIKIEDIATGNGLAMEARVELGRAVMITGPAWFGRLDLNGPERAAFNAYAAAKRARIEEAG